MSIAAFKVVDPADVGILSIGWCRRTEGVGNLLYDELVTRGRLFPKEEAMCLTQVFFTPPFQDCTARGKQSGAHSQKT